MSEPKLEHCRSCGKPVYWAKYRRRTDGMPGGFMPIDAEPDNRALGGNLVLFTRGGELWAEEYQSDKHDETRRRFTSHFSSCEHSKAWRKAR